LSAWIRSFPSSSFIPSTRTPLSFLFNSLYTHHSFFSSSLSLSHSTYPLTLIHSHSLSCTLIHSHSHFLTSKNSPSCLSFSPRSGFTQLPFRIRVAYSFSKHTF
jgi:hypothetical protein